MAKAKAKPHPLQPGGLAVAFLGLLLALWSFTGDRAFTFAYFFVALLGLVLVITGISASAYGRAVAPRRKRVTRDVIPTPKVVADVAPEPEPAPETVTEEAPALAAEARPADASEEPVVVRRGFMTRFRRSKKSDSVASEPTAAEADSPVVEEGPSTVDEDAPAVDESDAEPITDPPRRSLFARLLRRDRAEGAVEGEPDAVVSVPDAPDEPAAGDVKCPQCAHRFYLVNPAIKTMTCPKCGLRGRIPALVKPVAAIDPARRMRCPACATAFQPEGPAGSVAACPDCGLRGRVP